MELGLRTYFISKSDRFLTTAMFTGAVSTVHKFIKNSVSKFHFLVSSRL